jgi:hypothetical protein
MLGLNLNGIYLSNKMQALLFQKIAEIRRDADSDFNISD